MPRFVILEHDYPLLHWDFMLEEGPVLKTWRLAKPPENEGEVLAAIPLADHRLLYLDYEGPLSGNRGQVKRWDTGKYERLDEPQGLALRLEGTKTKGEFILEEGKGTWILRFVRRGER